MDFSSVLRWVRGQESQRARDLGKANKFHIQRMIMAIGNIFEAR